MSFDVKIWRARSNQAEHYSINSWEDIKGQN